MIKQQFTLIRTAYVLKSAVLCFASKEVELFHNFQLELIAGAFYIFFQYFLYTIYYILYFY